jgi:hypothetical protein
VPAFSASVELTIEDLLPRPEVQLALRDRDHDLPAHDLAFQMRVGVIFASSIMVILPSRFMRSQFLQPDLEIVQETC